MGNNNVQQWAVVLLHYDGAVEADKTFTSRVDAEKRAASCARYWAQFGTIVTVFPAKVAARLYK